MSLKLNSSGGGSVTLQEPTTASNVTLNLPATTGTVNTSGAVNEVPAGSASAPSIYPTGDTNTGIFFPAADTIAFTEGGVESARFDSSGNFFVGKTGANDNTNGFAVYNIGASLAGALSVAASTSDNSSSGFRQYSTGAGAYRFYVGYGGTINATSTSISGISDQSLKENIRDLETGLAQVMALKPRRFDWKEETKIGEKNVAGFVAQEVEQVLPELVYDYQYSENVTKKSLKMGDILPTLVKAIQEQQAMIDELKAKVAALEAK